MPQLPEPLERLIQELSRLPGIGPKTAQRLAFHLLRVDRVRADSLAQAIEDVKARIGYCERCYNIAEGPLCAICASPRRDPSVLCVVESAFDVLAIERTSEFSGLYFVLHGVISPIDGIGPEQIHVQQLLDRVRDEAIAEVIVATDADIEGEATALYLQRALMPLGATVTRPAHGLPVGGDLEYADELTLAKAMAGRRAF
ncbi:MAG: recombination protein RecR [Chloroflexi bacterium]|jgi:recombination protein RecR|nr:MAG: recombination protein RecR [Chloroflexota bacterium]TMF08283.1 MAG: recombination protein RecR [Chloroflexota bacterium]TMF52128.1 MAG: recombination protein RecR [Chloroflexota bacterium]TMG26032.1 MAG: recombination protein RecR [Chloroflexota bacterium]